MNAELSDGWPIFIAQYPQFTKVHRALAKMDWFADQGWSVYIGYYFAGIFMQVYRAHWFNHGLDGVHFETGFTAESLETGELRIDLHIGHRNLFDRARFNELTVPRMAVAAAALGDKVQFNARNLSDRLYVMVPFTKSGFGKQVAAGFAELCTTFGPIIDDGLAQLE
ncbi:MAG: hypothetical protein KC425_25995 [Anaerolineales bacterium]|nr:hypothetical protein [Anaerolineales bacterium]